MVSGVDSLDCVTFFARSIRLIRSTILCVVKGEGTEDIGSSVRPFAVKALYRSLRLLINASSRESLELAKHPRAHTVRHP